ncbi:MAG TPA: hypothetical protein VF235_03845 [Actinomycetota bacterium]
MSVVRYDDAEPIGLAELLGRLIEQNLARDPSRHRYLRPALVTIEATDAEVGATLRFDEGSVRISMTPTHDAPVRIRAEGRRLFDMVASKTRFGLPDALSTDGRAVVRAILVGRIRVRGLLTHLPTLRRLTMLLSAQ